MERQAVEKRKRQYFFIFRPMIIWCLTLFIPGKIFYEPVKNVVQVMRNPTSVQGTVVGLLPHDHRMVVVEYEVSGKAYQSRTSLPESLGLPRFEAIRLGDKVRIVYSPQHPENGIPGDPMKLLVGTGEDFALVASFLLLFSFGFDVYLRSWLQNHMSSRQS